MNSNDWQDIENVRNQAVAQLAEVCAAMGLSWSAGEKQFIIELPDVVSKSVTAQVVFVPTMRKTFDISNWGEPGPVEGMDDLQLPDYGEMLDEGVPPKGDKDAEK